MSTPRWTRWVLTVLRYGLCAAAIVYLAMNVHWYDHVRLNDGQLTRVRLLEMRGAEYVVERDGHAVTLPADKIHRLSEDELPDIEYGIASVVTNMNYGLAALALLLFLPVSLLQSLRLVWMMAIQDVRLTFWESVKLSFAGNFFNFALPGTTGGDLIKAYYITLYTHHKTEAVTTVFIDRVIGLLGLVIVATVMYVVSWGYLQWEPRMAGYLGSGLLFVWLGLIVATLVIFSRRLRHAAGLPQLAARLPGGEQILRIGRATVAIRRRRRLILASLVNTVVLQLFVVLSAWVMALALGMHGDFFLYFVCVPIGFLIAAIPITPPQAFGVLEWFYIQFFARDGLNTISQAFTYALAVRLIQLFWALPGVLVPLLGAHVPSRAELRALEGDGNSNAGAAAPTDQPAISSPTLGSANSSR